MSYKDPTLDFFYNLKVALQPLKEIAKAFKDNGLDEARPDWGDTENSDIELFSGRGGKCLLTLKDVIKSAEVYDSIDETLDLLGVKEIIE